MVCIYICIDQQKWRVEQPVNWPSFNHQKCWIDEWKHDKMMEMKQQQMRYIHQKTWKVNQKKRRWTVEGFSVRWIDTAIPYISLQPYPLVNILKTVERSTMLFMGKFSISMVIFSSYVRNYQRIPTRCYLPPIDIQCCPLIIIKKTVVA